MPSWFLTGESRPYDRQNGCFSRVIPRKNFDWGQGGWGAWELAGRVHQLQVDPKTFSPAFADSTL